MFAQMLILHQRARTMRVMFTGLFPHGVEVPIEETSQVQSDSNRQRQRAIRSE